MLENGSLLVRRGADAVGAATITRARKTVIDTRWVHVVMMGMKIFQQQEAVVAGIAWDAA